MRKQILHPNPTAGPTEPAWLDIERLATVEVTSEDPDAPIEGAFLPRIRAGWRAAGPGQQTIRLLFDEPQDLHRIQMLFIEEGRERPQEFVLRWSHRPQEPGHEIVRQQYHFSPNGSTKELEDYRVSLEAVQVIELEIVPDRNGGDAVATLAQMRLA